MNHFWLHVYRKHFVIRVNFFSHPPRLAAIGAGRLLGVVRGLRWRICNPLCK